VYSFAQSSKEQKRLDNLSKELNLSPKQMDDMRALKEESFIERNRLKEKYKNDRRTLSESHDKKLRAILDEKQYYAFKQKMRAHIHKKMKRLRNRNLPPKFRRYPENRF
jgi:hypothetical protein